MNPTIAAFASKALNSGHDAESILKMIMQQSPKLAPRLKQALAAGHSPESIIKFLGAPNEGDAVRRVQQQGRYAPEAAQQVAPEQMQAQRQQKAIGRVASTLAGVGLGAAALQGAGELLGGAQQPTATPEPTQPGGGGGQTIDVVGQILETAQQAGAQDPGQLRRIAATILKQLGYSGDAAREVMGEVAQAAGGLVGRETERFEQAYGTQPEQITQVSYDLTQKDGEIDPDSIVQEPWGIAGSEIGVLQAVNENDLGGMLTALLDGGNIEQAEKFVKRKLDKKHGDAEKFLADRNLSVPQVVEGFDQFLRKRDDTIPYDEGKDLDVDIISRPIPRSQIKSSVIRGFVYNPAKQEVVVQFNKGSVYKYKNVPQRVVDDLARGADSATTEGSNEFGYWWVGKNPSVGATFVRKLRNAGFEYERIS